MLLKEEEFSPCLLKAKGRAWVPIHDQGLECFVHRLDIGGPMLLRCNDDDCALCHADFERIRLLLYPMTYGNGTLGVVAVDASHKSLLLQNLKMPGVPVLFIPTGDWGSYHRVSIPAWTRDPDFGLVGPGVSADVELFGLSIDLRSVYPRMRNADLMGLESLKRRLKLNK